MPEQKEPPASRRARQIFQYLRAFNAQNNPVVRQIDDQPWHYRLRDLPDHPTVSISWPGDSEEESSFALEVRRADRTAPPEPPEVLDEWLKPGWEDPGKEVDFRTKRTIETEDGTRLVRFGDDEDRARALRTWKEKRDQWAQDERPARKSLSLFEELYGLYGRLDREAEQFELILGDGLLNWRIEDGGVHHPILSRRLQLSFDPEVPAFTIREAEPDTELYSSLFRILPDVEGDKIADLREEMEQGNFHPAGEEDTTGFLKRLVHSLSSDGQFQDGSITGEKSFPRLAREPMLFLRKRVLGFATAIEGVLDRIDEGKAPPPPLRDIAGVERLSKSDDRGAPSQAPELLLSKPANKEQRRVGERLERHGAVVVQGPPGTGKTHTIANLMGHLLANGKSILVTSHTSKALRRVRDQVVEPLQSLCVSALGADVQSRDELEQAISQMVSRLGEYDSRELKREANRLEEERTDLKQKLTEKKAELRQARRSEYDSIVIGGQEFHPTEAAKKVERERNEHGWIPGPVEEGAPLPLSEEEFTELYDSNRRLSSEEENELRGGLPELDSIPSPDNFAAYIEEWNALCERDLQQGSSHWTDSQTPSIDQLEEVREELESVVAVLDEAEEWQKEAIEAGRRGKGREETWEDLLSLIDRTSEAADDHVNYRVSHSPRLSEEKPLQDQIETASEIVDHLDDEETIGGWTLLWHYDWNEHVESWETNGSSPETKEEFEALLEKAKLEDLRRRLVGYWGRLVSENGGVSTDHLRDEPEETLRQYRQSIRNHLNWYEEQFRPVIERLLNLGYCWEEVYENTEPIPGRRGTLRRLRKAAQKTLGDIDSHIHRLKRRNLNRWYDEQSRELKEYADQFSGTLTESLYRCFEEELGEKYEETYREVERIHDLQAELRRRSSLLEKLEDAAPQWARNIRERVPPHDQASVPGDPKTAWEWRQLHDELTRRAEVSVDAIQREIDRLENELRATTQALIEKRAWRAQIEKIEADNTRRQALVGWADTQRKIGKGYGKNVPKLRKRAREQMKKSKDAVPAWIMPLTGVVENFDPRTAEFDVAIVDEASQVDVKGLLLLYLAEQVVVVGDHKQVSPSAVGEKIEEVNYLIEEHLQGIPNNHLYDGKTSIYDLARQSFGGAIGLREHFRCVPEIIQFSNALAYDFEIKPLRDDSTVDLEPHVVAHRVKGATYKNKLNEKEALRVASLVAAATEDPAYEDKSIGIVSLVGEKQAERIEELLRTHLDPVVFEQDHQILAGNPAQFQGDERDVMFLSVVNAPDEGGGPLRKRTRKLFQQRFNVAASRARDQMWVVHSLNPRTDLKEGDLRRRLIEHAKDPSELMELSESEEQETESPFERRVLRRLREEGYKVEPQWEVGAYRIDLVVVGSDGTKLAVECDGERYHPPEKLDEDMERQAILERLGWTFVRIRGSVFFRDPDEAMKPVFDRLDDLGIDPGADDATSNEDMSTELTDRIVRRARELRRKWTDQDNLDDWSEETNGETSKGQAVESSTSAKEAEISKPESGMGDSTRDSDETAEIDESDFESLFNTVANVSDTEGDTEPVSNQTDKPETGVYKDIDNIPESELADMLYYHLPDYEAVDRESLLQTVAKEFGFELNTSNRDLRSRLNKYIRRQIDAGNMEEINDWEKIRRA